MFYKQRQPRGVKLVRWPKKSSRAIRELKEFLNYLEAESKRRR